MSVDAKQLGAWREHILAAAVGLPAEAARMANGEGRYAREKAAAVCGQKKAVDTGRYRDGFAAADCVTSGRAGNGMYTIRFFNDVEYAVYLEYGFRSHFVPEAYLAGSASGKGGIFVGEKGGYVPGRFVFREACADVAETRFARIGGQLAAYLGRVF